MLAAALEAEVAAYAAAHAEVGVGGLLRREGTDGWLAALPSGPAVGVCPNPAALLRLAGA